MKSIKFYVYALCAPDDSIFYIGKGCGNRINQHEKDARKGKNSLNCEVIRQIWASGGTVNKRILAETDSEQTAFLIEADQIKHFGLDNLANAKAGNEHLVDIQMININGECRTTKKPFHLLNDSECQMLAFSHRIKADKHIAETKIYESRYKELTGKELPRWWE